MKSERIGNDIKIEWSILREGTPFSLSNKDVSIYLGSQFGRTKISGFTIDSNKVIWTFFGKDQKSLGKYSLVLVINEGNEGMITTDICDFVNLVSCSCEVGGTDNEDAQTETIALTSNLEYVASEYYDDTAIWEYIEKMEKAKADKAEIPTRVSQLENDADYATKGDIDGKQDKITDLDAIREGASKGATALQSIPAEFINESELSNALSPYARKSDIATINGKSIVNGGNIVIEGGSGGGSYDDTGIKKDISDLKAKDTLQDAELAKLSEEISESRSTGMNNFFIGNDKIYSFTKIYGLLPNSTYRIYFPKDYVFPQGASGAKLFIGYFIGTTEYRLAQSDSDIESYYDITTPSEFDYIVVGGRTTKDAKVWFSIHYYNDVITLSEEIKNNVSEIQKVNASITSIILYGQKANYVKDTILNTVGTEQNLVGYNYIKEYIPVKPTDTLLWRFGDEPKSWASLIVYDAELNYLDYFGGTSKTRTIKLSAYPTAAYIRVSFYPIFDGERNTSPISVSGKDFYLVEEIKGQKDAGLTEFGKIGEYYPNEISDVEGPLNYSEWVSNRLHFIHTSDNHGGDFGYADEYLDLSPAKFLINTGDIVVDKFADKDNSQTITLATSTAKPCYIVLGNHDYSRATSKQDVYNAFIQPTHAHNGVNSDKTYYSVDYSDEKVKCIMLDIADGYEDSEYANLGPTPLTTGNMSDEQISWLFTQLEDALANNLHVCIFSHVPPKDIDRERTIGEFSDIGKLDGKCYNLTFLADVVDAFINGESVSFTYKDKDYSHDFSNGGHFVAWFFGHLHYDECGWMKDHPNQFLVGVCRPRGGYVGFGSYDGDGLGVHFNYVTVDTSVKSLAVYRIGQQETIYATSRKSFRILYK